MFPRISHISGSFYLDRPQTVIPWNKDAFSFLGCAGYNWTEVLRKANDHQGNVDVQQAEGCDAAVFYWNSWSGS